MTIRKLAIYGTFACAFLVKAVYTQTETARPRKLLMQIHQVKAIKECRGPFGSLGADEIDLGAVVIDPVGGVRARTLDLGQFGHDGSTKNFNTPREFVAFKISGGSFPKVRQVILVLAERDAGSGFGKYLNKLVAEARSKIRASTDVASAVPRQEFLMAGFMQAEAAGKELAKEAARRLGKALLGVALDAREDDIFPASLASLTVTDAAFRFSGGKLTSPKTIVQFKKDKCDYTVTYSWRLIP
jgi:hypothetical protein